MREKIKTTKEGLDDLKREVEARNEKLLEIADRIDEARKQGDLSENAAYTAALADKELNQTKIKELEDTIARSVVVTANKSNAKIELGEKVRVKRVSDGEMIDYEIVGKNESDPSDNKISIESPIGKKLVGKEKGDKVKIVLPSGDEEFEIVKIL
jgi:transcription elongation factor GreA